jgi:formylglycine-generating enzyme required for sulfatase activity
MPTNKEYINSIGLKMVRIGPGSLMMGQEQRGDWDEEPVHKVNMTSPFCMSATEVTNAQYELFDRRHRRSRGRWDPSNADDEAVVFVSWDDAVAFCKWLSKKEGKPYRLPTEAEWEYACRAGTTGSYCTGEELPEVHHKNQKETREPEAVDTTVARTPANRWGLYDMHGNVEEWCLDWYGPYVEREQSDPVGRVDGDFRVTRGGSHSTEVHFLRSANRQGTLPEDKHWLVGFRVVMAEVPPRKPIVAADKPLWARKVSQKKYDWADGPNPNKPYFSGPKRYVKISPNSNGPMFSKHNHDPALSWCDNGDIFAIWYSCNRERGRELCVLASRLRRSAKQWDAAAPFWDGPDRNDHAPALLNDGQGTLYHFNGLSAASSYRKNLALVMRTSKDNSVTWSKGRLINPVRGMSNQPVASAFRTKEGYLVVPSDWPWHKDGQGTALWISRDNGKTWSTPEGRIAGIHAAVTQLDDGRLMALGRGSNINGRMPMSISEDMGQTWTYQASRFQPIGGGQRTVLLHLKEGPLFFASFGKDMPMTDAAGEYGKTSGLFGAISFDEGKHWPIRKLITPGGPTRKGTTMDGREFTMSPTSAEPRGYMAGIQAPDGVIHLISSINHYAFNLAWLKTPPSATEGIEQGGTAVEQTAFAQTDVFFAGELGYKEFRIPALVVTKGGTLLAISEAGWTGADAGDRDILLRRSTDGGQSWSEQVQMILDEGTSTCGSPACLVDPDTGRIHLMAAVDSTKGFHTYSDDDGQTWSKFREITGPFEALKSTWAWTRFDTGPARGIKLTRGKFKGRFIQPMWLAKDLEQYRSGVIYSDDQGVTWKPGGLISEVGLNTNECSVYEGVDGTLRMNIRGGDGLPGPRTQPYRLIATSNDGGLSWSKARYDQNLIGPRCLASTVRYSWPEEGRSRVLFANPADEKNRINVTVRLSYDEGKSWPVAKQIFAGPTAYSCLAQLPNGDIGLLYERGDRHRYEKMTFSRFTLDWLTDGKDEGEVKWQRKK